MSEIVGVTRSFRKKTAERFRIGEVGLYNYYPEGPRESGGGFSHNMTE